jgi:uncharacterized repeat protein (TIGR01451 family)
MRLLNVSYTHSRKGQINTDPYNYETPVEGAELSENGTKLYQDDREDFQLIDIEVNYDPARRGVSDFPYTVEGLQTNIYGEVNITLDKSILDVGYYRVYAEHDEDWNYKAINNESWFRVEPYVDLSVNKTADAYEYYIDDTVIWTIVVSNAENGTSATNVTLNDTFPHNFDFVSYTASEGTSYDHTTRVWTIGTLANGANVTLTIVSVAKANGTFTNHANVTANETEWNYTNNYDNATVIVNDFPSNKSSNVTNYTYYNSNITYYLTVANIGHDVYVKNITVVDALPEGIDYIRTVSVTGADVIINATLSNNNRTVTWVISNINPNTTAVITVLVNAHTVGNVTNNETVILHNGTNWTVNTTDDIRPIVDVSVNKTVDKELYYVGDVCLDY